MNLSSPPYIPPQLLRDLHLLDVLELTGTTHLAGQWLAVSQPTVSRRYRRLAADFGLKPAALGAKACRFGTSVSLRQLRLGFRWHRFETGVVALASDPLHQGLLEGLPAQVPMPMRFRPAAQWRQLVQEAVVDGALVSSLELEAWATRPAIEEQATGGWGNDSRNPAVEQVHLGHWPLALAGSGTSLQPEVLVPASPLAPGLRSLLVSQGLALATTSGSGAHDPAAWLRRLASCRLAAPVPELLLDRQQGDFGQLERLAARTPLREHLWLLLPGYWRSIPVLQATVAALLQLAVEAGACPTAPALPEEATAEKAAIPEEAVSWRQVG